MSNNKDELVSIFEKKEEIFWEVLSPKNGPRPNQNLGINDLSVILKVYHELVSAQTLLYIREAILNDTTLNTKGLLDRLEKIINEKILKINVQIVGTPNK